MDVAAEGEVVAVVAPVALLLGVPVPVGAVGARRLLRLRLDSRFCPCPWRYVLAILQQPMVRAHLDVAVPGSWRGVSSSAPAGGHVHWHCSTLRVVLDPAGSAQPATDLAWGWDQSALAQSFSTMGLTPLVSTERIADSGASFHTTPYADILSSVRPPQPLLSFFYHGW